MDGGNAMPARLQAALKLAADGFWLFPVQPGEKRPAVKGWQDAATRDANKIRDWFAPGKLNIGISTSVFGNGSEALLVFDLDNKNGKDGSRHFAEFLDKEGLSLPQTRVHSTPSGGEHVFFRVPRDQATVSHTGLLKGVDVRSAGALVVAPGSNTEQGAYQVAVDAPVAAAPDALRLYVKPALKKTDRPQAPPANLDHARALSRATEYLRNEAPLAVEGQGGDETTYKVAARCKDLGAGEQDSLTLMAEHWNPRCSPPWEPNDLAEKVANAYRYGTAQPGCAAPETVFGPVVPAAGNAPAPTTGGRVFKIRSFDQIAPVLDRNWLVEDVIPAGGFALLYAEPNAGKSFLAIDIGMAVARGVAWHEKTVEFGAVVYLAAEGSLSNRIEAYRRHHGLTVASIPFGLIEDGADLYRSKSDTSALIEAAQSFAAAHKQPLQLIIIDTLAQVLGNGDENSGQDLGAVIANVRRIQRATHAAVLVVHHLGKDVSKKARGHSSLPAAIDTALEVKDGTIAIEKQRDGEKGRKYGFRLIAVPIGTTARGKPLSSCVVAYTGAGAREDFAGQHVKRDSVAGRALTVLEDLTLGGGQVADAVWRDEFAQRHYSDKDRRTQWSAFSRAADTLEKARRIIREGGHVAPAPN